MKGERLVRNHFTSKQLIFGIQTKEEILYGKSKRQHLIIDEMKSRTISAISIFVIVVLAYQITAVFKNLMFATIVTALCIDSVVWKGSILKYFNNFWKIIHKKERRRMHAATHKVLNAYEFLKSVPNTDEATKYSSFTENCDDAKIALES